MEDPYAFGATVIFLLTGKEPHELPKSRLKIEFSGSANIPEDLAEWIDHLVEPAPEDRFQNAQDALDELRDLAITSQSDKLGAKSRTTELLLPNEKQGLIIVKKTDG